MNNYVKAERSRPGASAQKKQHEDEHESEPLRRNEEAEVLNNESPSFQEQSKK